jgi:hypothetical protein
MLTEQLIRRLRRDGIPTPAETSHITKTPAPIP